MIEVYCETCDVLVDVDGYTYRDEAGDPALEVTDGGDHDKHDLAIPTGQRSGWTGGTE